MVLGEFKFIAILVVVALVVLVMANLELYLNKRRSFATIAANKYSNILLPKDTGLMDPVYVYNSKKIKRRDLNYQVGYSTRMYSKRTIHEHIASRVMRPIKEFFYILKSIPKSYSPINTLYTSFGKSGEVLNNADPLTFNPLSDYKILSSKRDNVEAFFSDGKIYLVKGRDV